MTTTDTIAGGYRMAAAVVHRLVDDLTADDFRHQPCPGANSAAWIVGHLAVSLRRTAERLGETDLPAAPAELIARFTQSGKAAGDQAELGDPAELLRLFDACTEKVIARVRQVSAERLAGPPSLPGMATTFAEGLLFGVLHLGMHAGQLSTIRRSLGKPPMV